MLVALQLFQRLTERLEEAKADVPSLLYINLLLTEREGCPGEYWPPDRGQPKPIYPNTDLAHG